MEVVKSDLIDYNVRDTLRRLMKSKTKVRKMDAGLWLMDLMKEYKIQSPKVLAQELGMPEQRIKRILLFTNLNLKPADKPNWMRSVMEMRKDGILREDGSTAGKII